jgi:hypothetical protein
MANYPPPATQTKSMYEHNYKKVSADGGVGARVIKHMVFTQKKVEKGFFSLLKIKFSLI